MDGWDNLAWERRDGRIRNVATVVYVKRATPSTGAALVFSWRAGRQLPRARGDSAAPG